jgi:hypothetical protein
MTGRPAPCARFDDQLALAAGDDLSQDEAAALRLHLPTCEGCREALLEYRSAIQWARATDGNASPAPFDDAELGQLHGRITAAVERTPRSPSWLMRLLVLLVPQIGAPSPTGGKLRGWSAGLFGLGTVASAALLFVLTADSRQQVSQGELGTLDLREPSGAATSSASEGEPEPVLLANAEGTSDQDLEPPSDIPLDQRPLKIEIRTKDPKIKIIWLAQP